MKETIIITTTKGNFDRIKKTRIKARKDTVPWSKGLANKLEAGCRLATYKWLSDPKSTLMRAEIQSFHVEDDKIHLKLGKCSKCRVKVKKEAYEQEQVEEKRGRQDQWIFERFYPSKGPGKGFVNMNIKGLNYHTMHASSSDAYIKVGGGIPIHRIKT